MSDKSPVIRIDGGCKYWHAGSQTIVIFRDIDLCVNRGESLAIIGPSGAGKSTLLHVLGFLTFLDEGSIWFENEKITVKETARVANIRPDIGFVFQDGKLLPELTVLANVCLPLAHRGIWPARQKELATEALVKVGLENRLHHKSNQLSGGEIMRVAIARAFVQKPKVFLADEPTGNLDSKTGDKVADLIFNSVSPDHATVFVTHNAQLAQRADRILNLRDGKIENRN